MRRLRNIVNNTIGTIGTTLYLGYICLWVVLIRVGLVKK